MRVCYVLMLSVSLLCTSCSDESSSNTECEKQLEACESLRSDQAFRRTVTCVINTTTIREV
jgi:hypothetical protein